MAFGSPITDGTLEGVGTNGSIVGFDLSSLNASSFIQIQLQDSLVPVMSAVIIGETTKDGLFNYLEDSEAPEIAWTSEAGRIYVFINASDWEYISTTRIAIWYNQEPEELDNVSDVVIPDRIPAEARNLFVLLCAKESQTLSGVNPSRDILQQINAELIKLGLN